MSDVPSKIKDISFVGEGFKEEPRRCVDCNAVIDNQIEDHFRVMKSIQMENKVFKKHPEKEWIEVLSRHINKDKSDCGYQFCDLVIHPFKEIIYYFDFDKYYCDRGKHE